MKKILTLSLAALVLAGSVACAKWPWEDSPNGPTTIQQQNVTVTVGQPTPTPSTSPSPSACTPTRLGLGTVLDKTEIPIGGTLGLSVDYFLAGDAKLPASCDAPAPELDTPIGPCVLEGSYSQGNLKLRASTTATVGQTCTTRARGQGLLSESLTVTVSTS